MDWDKDFPTVINLPTRLERDLPPNFQDVRYTPELVEYFLERYTDKGDRILDPFVGFGTTMIVANALQREGWGIEIDDSKVAYLREVQKIKDRLIHGDIKRLFLDKVLPDIDCIITSPPYMGREDQANALSGYRYAGNYENYLQDMQNIFANLKTVLADGAVIIVEISNLKQENSLTTLAWDVGEKLGELFEFRGEIIINWQGERQDGKQGIYNYGYDHSYCLIYSNTSSL